MVSVDALDNAIKMTDGYKVPFPLLSDPAATAHDAYKVSLVGTPERAKKLKSYGIDVQRWSKRDHDKIAIPSMFLIDKGGVVRFAHASHDHRTRPKLDELLPALEKALQAAPKSN